MSLVPEEKLKPNLTINLAPMIDFLFLMLAFFATLAVTRVTLFDTKWEECPNRFLNTSSLYNYSTDEYYKEYIPLWALEDCLEFLRKRKWYIHNLHDDTWGNKTILYIKNPNKIRINEQDGKTPLEACLRAVLAVLEKEK